MLGLKLNHVSKNGHSCYELITDIHSKGIDMAMGCNLVVYF